MRREVDAPQPPQRHREAIGRPIELVEAADALEAVTNRVEVVLGHDRGIGLEPFARIFPAEVRPHRSPEVDVEQPRDVDPVIVALTPVQLVQRLGRDGEGDAVHAFLRRGVDVQERHVDCRALARLGIDVVLVARDCPTVAHCDVPGPAVAEKAARDPAGEPQ